ncbi:hypothetical protein OFC47_25260, partial [Escherichia coli]|nr:hypothetical protein [Escherichia coli]
MPSTSEQLKHASITTTFNTEGKEGGKEEAVKEVEEEEKGSNRKEDIEIEDILIFKRLPILLLLF